MACGKSHDAIGGSQRQFLPRSREPVVMISGRAGRFGRVGQVDDEPRWRKLNGGPGGRSESAWAGNLGDLQSTLWRGWVIARQTLALAADFPLNESGRETVFRYEDATQHERHSMQPKGHTRRMRGLAAIGGFSLLAGALLAGPATAQSTSSSVGVSTGAVVGGDATPPVIECGWALTDANSRWVKADTDPLMNYGQDDNPDARPLDGEGVVTPPCKGTGTADNSGAAEMKSDENTILVHVKPNAHDEPSEKYVELWGGVKSNNFGVKVYFDVYHPDGTLKKQIDARKYASRETPALKARCVGPAGMYNAAQATGQLNLRAVANMTRECQDQQKILFYGAFGISKHQPWGKYKIIMRAFNPNGAQVTQTFAIWVIPFLNLEKDFDTVDFGKIYSNDHFNQVTSGDFVYGDNLGPVILGKPSSQSSIRNTGNAGMSIGLRFSSLCLVGAASCTGDKRVDEFDAKFGVGSSDNLQYLGEPRGDALRSNLNSDALPAPYGDQYNFDDTFARTLCPNDVGKIEFSIWTGALQTGEYTSPNGIQIVARNNRDAKRCPTDVGSVYVANRGLPQFGNPPTPTSTTHWPFPV